jgi:outer membrane murein-binding lipoprotein Lpp
MEDVMTAIESVYDRLRAAQEENAKLRKLVADYKEMYEDMKACRDECYTLAHTSIDELKTMRKRIAAVLDGGAA